MRYIIPLLAAIILTSCGEPKVDDSTETEHADSATAHADSVKRQQEEDEVAEEIIEGSFDALNR